MYALISLCITGTDLFTVVEILFHYTLHLIYLLANFAANFDGEICKNNINVNFLNQYDTVSTD